MLEGRKTVNRIEQFLHLRDEDPRAMRFFEGLSHSSPETLGMESFIVKKLEENLPPPCKEYFQQKNKGTCESESKENFSSCLVFLLPFLAARNIQPWRVISRFVMMMNIWFLKNRHESLWHEYKHFIFCCCRFHNWFPTARVRSEWIRCCLMLPQWQKFFKIKFRFPNSGLWPNLLSSIYSLL